MVLLLLPLPLPQLLHFFHLCRAFFLRILLILLPPSQRIPINLLKHRPAVLELSLVELDKEPLLADIGLVKVRLCHIIEPEARRLPVAASVENIVPASSGEPIVLELVVALMALASF